MAEYVSFQHEAKNEPDQLRWLIPIFELTINIKYQILNLKAHIDLIQYGYGVSLVHKSLPISLLQ